ncbi:MAG: 30S ribosomal protein S17 [Deltaproteobacteria bacterium]|nr:30S ribosomal protein S17 [Deltaproteobacteria bacterium]
MSNSKRTFEGVVLSNKMDKTVVVQIKESVMHPVFKKYHTVKKKYKAHDPKNECTIGDRVVICESRPLSKHKRWAVMKIVQKAA